MGKEIKNLKKVAQRIEKAIKNKEKIILYGDADLDGVTSVIILKETIKNLGGEISKIYFPDREVEGYGLSKIGLEYLKKYIPALLITLDLGIGNFKEVKLAKKLGFEVIIIDHHEVLDELPAAEIIVDPKQKGDKYPFKGLATAGIVFKLSELLLKNYYLNSKTKLTENIKRDFLELVALATIADMMPCKNENEYYIEEGLKSLEHSWRPGIQALLKEEFFNGYLSLNQKVSKIISVLNIRDIQDKLPASFRIFTAPSLQDAQIIIKNLIKKTELRKIKINEIIEEIEKRIYQKQEPIIFEGDENFEFTLISPVASNLCQKYKKPTFVFKKLEKESQGTVRTPQGIDSVALMKKCKNFLITYGGHPQASGFRIKNENLENFKKCLIKNLLKF